jgi:adenine-specific DNA-methyltransferase
MATPAIPTPPKVERFKQLLRELFMFDQADLDFGIYRIMNAKRDEITRFLDNDLLPQVADELKKLGGGDRNKLEAEYAAAVATARTFGVPDPDNAGPVLEIRKKLETAVDTKSLEEEIFSDLYNFFRRYYSQGDFMSLRRYKEGVYAIPYEGEEVKLHWANADQYYIKSSEYLRDYTFKLGDGKRVHFKLISGDVEQNNNKPLNGGDRRFLLSESDPLLIEGGELVIRFEFRADQDKRKQTDLNKEAVSRVFSSDSIANWMSGLAERKPTEKNPERTLLDKHFAEYTARNTFDYFVHKDLGGFLRRELDFFVKNEVLHIDDVEQETDFRVQERMSRVRAIRRIAHKIISLLEQLENFQKKLWLKKKFVVETNYCITLATIPKQLYPQIAANDAQREEWARLFAINEIEADLSGVGYSEPLSEAFLAAHQGLVVDTRHFSSEFKDLLVDSVDEIDKQTDGLLIHGDNFHALNLLQKRYRSDVDCIYIDPPYNTGDSQIPYKNEYLRSSWLTLIDNRLDLGTQLLKADSVMFIAIDDFEMANLAKLIDTQYSSLQREMIIVNHHPQGGKSRTLAHTHEYMLTCINGSPGTLAGRSDNHEVELRPFKRSGTAESNFRYGRANSFYAILVDPASRIIMGLESPPVGDGYPTGTTAEGYVRIYPIGANGEERVWRRSYESCFSLLDKKKLQCSEGMTIYQEIAADERTAALFSNWVDPRYNAGTFGANLLRDILGVQNLFSYPKSLHTVGDAIFATQLDEGACVLDYFGGSGTTGHAVINLNRADGLRRRFILVEAETYFDTVLLPRIKKVTYAAEWKEGKPTRSLTPEEWSGTPRIVKTIRLESYEDALNNLEARRTPAQQAVLDGLGSDADSLQEQYRLSYMLDVETRASDSLLTVEAFRDPTEFSLRLHTPGSDETRNIKVDMIETFNWLLGLRIGHIAAPQTFRADFERVTDGPIRLKGNLSRDLGGNWWFRSVTGTTPQGDRALVIWRKLTGTPEQDNLVLDQWFLKRNYSTKDYEFDVIYVNGDNNLENLRKDDETWKVRLIEEEFLRLMFEGTEA